MLIAITGAWRWSHGVAPGRLANNSSQCGRARNAPTADTVPSRLRRIRSVAMASGISPHVRYHGYRTGPRTASVSRPQPTVAARFRARMVANRRSITPAVTTMPAVRVRLSACANWIFMSAMSPSLASPSARPTVGAYRVRPEAGVAAERNQPSPSGISRTRTSPDALTTPTSRATGRSRAQTHARACGGRASGGPVLRGRVPGTGVPACHTATATIANAAGHFTAVAAVSNIMDAIGRPARAASRPAASSATMIASRWTAPRSCRMTTGLPAAARASGRRRGSAAHATHPRITMTPASASALRIRTVPSTVPPDSP